MRFDLHSHSTHSDGLLRPAELVARAAAQQVEFLALTDHDETGGLAEARTACASTGVSLIAGVEVSAMWTGHSIHVIGLHVDPANPELAAGLADLRAGRRTRADAIAAELEKVGIGGCLAGALAYVTNPELVGRAHFARFLVERGYARDMQAVFKSFLVPGKPGYVPHRWASLAGAIRWIRASGGMAVLAHPGRYRLDTVQKEDLFGEFRDAGGVGMEVISGSHTVAEYAYYARYAARYGLLASAGSDFHGPGMGRCDLGALPDLPSGCGPIWQQF